MTFKWSEKDLQSLYDFIGFSEKSGEFFSNSMENHLRKLIFDNSSPAPNSPNGEQITSDVPLTQPSLQERAKTDPALKEFLDKVKPVDELPPPPCPFVSKGYIDKKLGIQLIYCASHKYKTPVTLALSVCIKCWERREYMKKKRERETEEKGIEEPEQIEVPNCSERDLRYKGAENDPNAVHDFGEQGKKIYCMRFGDWKPLDFCIDCFKGGKSATIDSGVIETEEEGDGYQ
jgi:hypothetical protein